MKYIIKMNFTSVCNILFLFQNPTQDTRNLTAFHRFVFSWL